MSRHRLSLHDLEAHLRGQKPRRSSPASSLSRLERELKGSGNGSTSRAFDRGRPVAARFNASRESARTGATFSLPAAFSQGPEMNLAAWVEPFEAVGYPPGKDPPWGSAGSPPSPPVTEEPIPDQFTGRPGAPPTVAQPVREPLKPLAPTEVDDDLDAIRRTAGTPPAPTEPKLQTDGSAPPAPEPSLAGPAVPTAPAEPAAPAAPAQDPHAIFEQMGRAMRYANTFSLGPVELSRRFNQIEYQLETEEAVAAPRKPRQDPDGGETEEDLRTIAALRKTSAPEHAAVPSAPIATPSAPADPAVVMPWLPVRHEVAWIGASEGLSSAAAAAAMLAARRDGLPAEAAAVIEGRGGWERYREGLTVKGEEFFRAWGLVRGETGAPEVERVRGLLEAHGPLWYGPHDGGGPAKVISGIHGGPQQSATRVEVLDPGGTPGPRTVSFLECFTLLSGAGDPVLAWSGPAPQAG